MLREEADLSHHLLAAQGILGGDVELDMDRVDAEHSFELRTKWRPGEAPRTKKAGPAMRKPGLENLEGA